MLIRYTDFGNIAYTVTMKQTTDTQVNEYKSYQIHSYKYTGQYGHHRISKVVRPDGSVMDGLKFGFKNGNGNGGNLNIGRSHKKCVEFAAMKIDWELDGCPVLPESEFLW